MLFDAQLSPIQNDGSPLTDNQISIARDITGQATAQLESLLRIYYLRHGFEAYDSMLLVHLVHLANVTLTRIAMIERSPSLRETSGEDIETLRSTLILCLKGLHDQSKNFYLSGVVFDVMKNRLSAENRDPSESSPTMSFRSSISTKIPRLADCGVWFKSLGEYRILTEI
jgi:hypothetical protein